MKHLTPTEIEQLCPIIRDLTNDHKTLNEISQATGRKIGFIKSFRRRNNIAVPPRPVKIIAPKDPRPLKVVVPKLPRPAKVAAPVQSDEAFIHDLVRSQNWGLSILRNEYYLREMARLNIAKPADLTTKVDLLSMVPNAVVDGPHLHA